MQGADHCLTIHTFSAATICVTYMKLSSYAVAHTKDTALSQGMRSRSSLPLFRAVFPFPLVDSSLWIWFSYQPSHEYGMIKTSGTMNCTFGQKLVWSYFRHQDNTLAFASTLSPKFVDGILITIPQKRGRYNSFLVCHLVDIPWFCDTTRWWYDCFNTC